LLGVAGGGGGGQGRVLGLSMSGGEVIALEGRRWQRVPGTARVVGIHFERVLGGNVGFEGTLPLAGTVWLSELQWEAGVGSDPKWFHELQLAVGDQVPTTDAEIDALEQLFPRASAFAGALSSLFMYSIYRSFRVRVGLALVMIGRRCVGRLQHLGGGERV